MARETDLFRAISDRNLDGMNEILSRDENVNELTKAGMPPLIYALENMQPTDSGTIDEIISRLIDLGADVNAIHEKSRMSATMLAIAKNRRDELILKFIHAGANVNFESAHKQSMLVTAMKNNCGKTVIRALISNGADVNIPSREETALFCAVTVRNDPDIIEMLLEAGADITSAVFPKPLLALCCKERCKPYDICKYKRVTDILIRKGVKLNERDSYGNTIIHQATCNYVFNVARRSGVSLDATNNCGITPLLKSLIYKDNDKVNDLLLIGADPNWRDSNDNNILHYSDVILSGSHIDLLLYHGTNFLDTNNTGETPVEASFRDKRLFNHDNYLLEMKSLITHGLLYATNLGLDKEIEQLESDRHTKSNYVQFVAACLSELNSTRNTLLKKDMSIYDFCHEKRYYRSSRVDIKIDEYLITHDAISENFPIYKDVIFMRLKDNSRENFKRLLLYHTLFNVIVSPASAADGGKFSSPLSLLRFYQVGKYLNYKTLYALIEASFYQ